MTLRKQIAFLLVSILALLLVACAQTQPENPTPPTGVPSGSPSALSQAVLNAQAWLAEQIDIPVEQLEIVSMEQVEWTDSCLGLGQPNESCLQAITPGWQVIFEAGGKSYEVRTDESGTVIRMAPQDDDSAGETGLENTQWNLMAFGSPGAEEPLVEGSKITLTFADGQAGGSGGCNSYGGQYQVDGDMISLDQMVSTLMACADDRVTQQEGRYFQALESASRFEMQDNRLLIIDDSGQGLLIFELAGPASTP
ncbi:MAG: META domain-containing protein [Chloroflexota bacterium]|nr:MAG: META domain-containing protein [Chloroflexota bacterium]